MEAGTISLVTNQQLYLAIGVPVVLNVVLTGVILAYVNGQIDSLRRIMESRFQFLDRRFDDLRDLWRAELHRVEEVLDARLKHLEER